MCTRMLVVTVEMFQRTLARSVLALEMILVEIRHLKLKISPQKIELVVFGLEAEKASRV